MRIKHNLEASGGTFRIVHVNVVQASEVSTVASYRHFKKLNGSSAASHLRASVSIVRSSGYSSSIVSLRRAAPYTPVSSA